MKWRFRRRCRRPGIRLDLNPEKRNISSLPVIVMMMMMRSSITRPFSFRFFGEKNTGFQPSLHTFSSSATAGGYSSGIGLTRLKSCQACGDGVVDSSVISMRFSGADSPYPKHQAITSKASRSFRTTTNPVTTSAVRSISTTTTDTLPFLTVSKSCMANFSSSSAAVSSHPSASLPPLSAKPEETGQQRPHQLYMWGTNTKGSLLKPAGMQVEKAIDVPQLIQPDPSWFTPMDNNPNATTGTTSSTSSPSIAQVICGPTDTAFLTTDGRCYVFGENKEGQLGLGHKDPVTVPTLVNLPMADPATTRVQQVVLGQKFSAWIDTAGDLYTAGFGGSPFSGMGALGHGNAQSYLVPTLVESLMEDGCYAQQVQVGEAHMTVLTTEGEVLTTGAGSYGRLGNFETQDQLYLEPVEILTQGVVQIAGGKSFTLALTKEGVVYGWGRNHKGQLGTGLGLAVDLYAMSAVPEPVLTEELLGRKVVALAAGHSHAACITSSGELFHWGMTIHLEPVRVDSLVHTQIVQVACGHDYTLALDKNGRMYSMGPGGATGVLGQGSTRRLNQAALVEALGEQQKVVQMSAGWKHAACLVQDSSA